MSDCLIWIALRRDATEQQGALVGHNPVAVEVAVERAIARLRELLQGDIAVSRPLAALAGIQLPERRAHRCSHPPSPSETTLRQYHSMMPRSSRRCASQRPQVWHLGRLITFFLVSCPISNTPRTMSRQTSRTRMAEDQALPVAASSALLEGASQAPVR